VCCRRVTQNSVVAKLGQNSKENEYRCFHLSSCNAVYFLPSFLMAGHRMYLNIVELFSYHFLVQQHRGTGPVGQPLLVTRGSAFP
jgi:hypothetical protein